MPEISRFFGIIIQMYHHDNEPLIFMSLFWSTSGARFGYARWAAFSNRN